MMARLLLLVGGIQESTWEPIHRRLITEIGSLKLVELSEDEYFYKGDRVINRPMPANDPAVAQAAEDMINNPTEYFERARADAVVFAQQQELRRMPPPEFFQHVTARRLAHVHACLLTQEAHQRAVETSVPLIPLKPGERCSVTPRLSRYWILQPDGSYETKDIEEDWRK